MKFPLTALLAAALFLAGCATQTKEQIAAVRTAGVSPALVRKLEHGGRLSPADIIELHRRQVNDAVALRQLDRTGVDYVVDKNIVRQLRNAGVSESVITAAKVASDRYADQFHRPYVSVGYSPWADPYYYPYAGYPYDPYSYGYSRPYPRYESYPRYQQYHHHRSATDFLPPGPHLLFR